MPAIVTHDLFGRDLLLARPSLAGSSSEERDAFLLGNQGPDPLFFLRVDPRARNWLTLGSIMHKQRTPELIVGMRRAVDALGRNAQRGPKGEVAEAGARAIHRMRMGWEYAKSERGRGSKSSARPSGGHMQDDRHLQIAYRRPSDYDIGLAYALGFLGHYALDSHAHPLVYWYQYGICDAGEPGLERRDGPRVHAVIECTLDEMMLYAKRHETVREFKPHERILNGSVRVLDVVSQMYAQVFDEVYELEVPRSLYRNAVQSYRVAQRALYSPGGTARKAVTRVEKLAGKRYSFYSSMTHRVRHDVTCSFDNHEHALWENPATGEASTESFVDVYERAQKDALTYIDAFANDLPIAISLDNNNSTNVSGHTAWEITHGLNFSGRPVG